MRKMALLLALLFTLSLLLPVASLAAEEKDYGAQLTEDFYSFGLDSKANKLAAATLKITPVSKKQYETVYPYVYRVKMVLRGRTDLSQLNDKELLSLYKVIRAAARYLNISMSYKSSKTSNGYVVSVSYDGKLIGSYDTHGQSAVARTDWADSSLLLALGLLLAALASAGYLYRRKKTV